jgi:histidinol phosphatase-like PHP family hydrolase
MKYKIDHDFHIHTHLSSCSGDPAQTTSRVLEYAEAYKLHTVAITNHFWDSDNIECPIPWYLPQDFAHLCKALPLPQSPNVKFLFGCETEMGADHQQLGISEERIHDFDFVIVPTTHLHMPIFNQEASTEERAQIWCKRLAALLQRNLPFRKMGLAHLSCTLMDKSAYDGAIRILQQITDEEFEKLFSLAAEKGLGIEINENPLRYDRSEWSKLFRPYKIAKSCGCKFYFGSDAHKPEDFAKAIARMELFIDELKLSESDKFILQQ